jgi:hypothetical protein
MLRVRLDRDAGTKMARNGYYAVAQNGSTSPGGLSAAGSNREGNRADRYTDKSASVYQ